MNRVSIILLVLILGSSFAPHIDSSIWGFFGHRKITKLAVFTLPPDMMPLYKTYIDYLTTHSVDADKRRYTVSEEAIRHYVDVDYWGQNAINIIPHSQREAVIKFADYYLVENGDSLLIRGIDHAMLPDEFMIIGEQEVDIELLSALIWDKVNFYEGTTVWSLPLVEYEKALQVSAEQSKNYTQLVIKDRFTDKGISPYYIKTIYNRLIKAYEDKQMDQILRLSADIAHYVSDIHVPLHTSYNYNGQLTDQEGIHAFWETRLPKLYADAEYDLFVGKADYVNDIQEYSWDIIKHSHSLVDSVLQIEKRLSHTFTNYLQYCFEDTELSTVRVQCEAYSRAYHDALGGMVEDQMRRSIKAVGSVWLSAWADAGQPNMSRITAGTSITNPLDSIELQQNIKKQ